LRKILKPSILMSMKNLFGVFAIFLLTVSSSFSAQEASRAAAIAEQQDAAERYQRLSAQIEDLLTANATLQRRVGELENELRKTRAEMLAEISKVESRAESGNSKLVSQDQLKKVIESINDVDKKRADEDKKIVDSLRKSLKDLEKLPTLAPAVPTPTPTPNKNTEHATASSGPMKGFEHTVAKGEYLTSIIKAYNEALKEKGVTKKITQDMVMKANPDLNPNKMVIGQKIFIPDPSQQ
jgi:predicted RNase H-like nuclease (RuvC/YqgF family)